jgi:hypothetical protein
MTAIDDRIHDAVVKMSIPLGLTADEAQAVTDLLSHIFERRRGLDMPASPCEMLMRGVQDRIRQRYRNQSEHPLPIKVEINALGLTKAEIKGLIEALSARINPAEDQPRLDSKKPGR